MEEKLPVLKVYEIDYSFIIKNYLNPEMWSKTWTLFQYKGWVFKLNIARILCDDERIVFNLKLEDVLNPESYRSDYWISYPQIVSREIYYSLKIDKVSFLKRQIYSAMKELIVLLEQRRCKTTDGYKEIEEAKVTEKETLRQIAEDFLNENRVYNYDIRDVYIENYIDNNLTINEKLEDYIAIYKYKLLTDLYLILAETQNDKKYIEKVLEENEDGENILEEVREYLGQLETEEFIEELKDELEDL